MQQAPQHERKFLQCRDDDLCPVDECLGQLLRITVNGLHHSLLVLDLVNRILELLIQHLPVSDHDHAIKHLFILGIMEAGQTVGEP